MGLTLRNFTVPINEGIILTLILIIGVSYYLFFAKHHKRNELKFAEIYPLVINYAVLCFISILFLILGVDTVLTGYIYNDEIYEVIKELVFGLLIIILDIWNFIFYVKSHNIDLVQSEREIQAEADNRIADWIKLIVLILMIIVSIFNIFKYMQFIDVVERNRQVGIAVFCIVSAIFLLYSLNPLNIREKLHLKKKR